MTGIGKIVRVSFPGEEQTNEPVPSWPDLPEESVTRLQ